MSPQQDVGRRAHSLTSVGVRAAKDWLASLREGKSIPFPTAILTEPRYALPVEPEVTVEPREFRDRRDAALYLDERLKPLGGAHIASDHGLWSWLGLFYFDQICRQDPAGKLQRTADIACVIDPANRWGWTETMHHRLWLSHQIWRQHGERAWYLLSEPARSLGQFALRLTDKPQLFRAEGAVELAQELYVDRAKHALKPHALAQSRAQASPGSLPRLIDVLNQLSMTFDVYGMSAEQLLHILPPEFDRFRPLESVEAA